MSFTDNYLALMGDEKKKKKKKAEKESTQKSGHSFTDNYNSLVAEDDIAPILPSAPVFVNKTAPLYSDIAPVTRTAVSSIKPGKSVIGNIKGYTDTGTGGKTKEEKRKWFEKGAFEDGYQFGDVMKTILGTGTDVTENASAGIIGMGEKVVDALAYVAPLFAQGQFYQNGGAYQPVEVQQAFNESIATSKQGMSKFIAKDLYNEETIAKKIVLGTDANSVLGEKSDALAQSGGQLLATVGLQAVGVPWFVTTGATSFGSQAEVALYEGAGYEEAGASAAISAGAEILTEKLSGGIKFGGKTLDDVLLKPLTDKISSKTVKTLVNLGVDAAGEGFEEVLSGAISNLGTALYKEENVEELLFSEEAMDEYIESFLGGSVLGGVGSGVHAIQDGKRIHLTENEQKVVEHEYEKRIADQDLTTKQKNDIRNKVIQDMERGRISTDTIEEVLGGEDYTRYQDTIKQEDGLVEQEKTLKEEFDALNQMKQSDMTGEQIDRRLELKEQLEELRTTIESTKNHSAKDLLRQRLSGNVMSFVQNDRLAESYNERSRRGQAYQVDLSKYDDKQRDTIQKAIDSGILNNTNRTHEFVDMIAKITADKGVLFDFTNNERLKESGFAVDGAAVNGYVTKDGVTLNIDSAKSLNSVVGHEITHVLEGTEMYTALQSVVTEYAKTKGEYQSRYDALAKLYEGVEGADINAELTADLVGDYLFTDTDFVKHLSVTNRNVFQKIYDEIKYLCKVATAGSKEARELEKAKRVFAEVYRESGKAQTDTKYQLSSNAKTELHKALYDTQYRSEVLLRDVSPAIMVSQKGVKNLPMAMNASHIRENVFTEDEAKKLGLKVDDDTHYHGLGEDFFLKIIDGLDNVKVAYRGTRNASNPARGENYFLLVSEFKDDAGNTINVPVYIDEHAQVNRVFVDVNKISTVFGRDAFQDYINRQVRNGDLVRIKNKDTQTSERPALIAEGYGEDVSNVGQSGNSDTSLLGDSVAQGEPTVKANYSLSDSDGRQLSKEQQDYFKKSKVRDENGNLKVVYHGSPADFNTFSLDYLGTNGTAEGYGFYFTDKKSIAENYSRGREGQQNGAPGKLFEVYLDIKKPLSDTEVTMSRAQFKKFLTTLNKQTDADGEPLDILSNYGDVAWEGLNNVLNYAMEIEYDGSDSDVNLVHSIINGCGNLEVVLDVLRKTTGYDGIIVENATWGEDQKIYLAFHPEQIKNVDNLNPTADPDTRRSLSSVGEQAAPVNGRGTFGKDIALETAPVEEVAPVRETVAESATVEENATVSEGATPVSDNKVPTVLYNVRSGSGGWGVVYGTAQEALNDAVHHVNADLWNAITTEIENATDKKNYPTPMIDALVAVQEDVRQEAITPMQGAQLLNEAYSYGGASALRGLFNPGTGNLYQKYLDKAKGYETVALDTEPMFPDDFAPIADDPERFDSLDDADAPPVRNMEYGERGNQMTMPKTTVNMIADNVRESLWVDDRQIGKVRSLVEEYGKQEFPDRNWLFRELKDNFGKHTEKMVDETTQEVKSVLRKYRLNVSDAIKGDIADYNDLRRRNFGKVLFSRQGMDVDSAYEELSAMYPGYFPNEITNPTDQLLQIIEVANMNGATEQTYELDDDTVWDVVDDIAEAVSDYQYIQMERDAGKAMPKEAFDDLVQNADAYAPLIVRDTPSASGKGFDAPVYDAQPSKGVVDGQQSVFKEEPKPETEEERRQTRKQLHQNIVDGVKADFKAKGLDFDKVLKNAKNLSTFATVDNMPQRVMEKALGYKEGQTLSDLTVNKVAQNETEGIKWLNSYTDRKSGLLKQLSARYNIKPGSKESAAAQMYAEGFYVAENNDIIAYGDAELAKDFPDAKVQANIKGLANDPRIRRIYDDTLAMINASRTRNAYPEIPRLDNYFLHFRAMDDTFSKLGLPFNPNDIRAKDLPTDLNGVTADLKPGQPYFASAMHRTGKRTSFDLLGGLERYLSSAKNQIYHIDDIQTLRALRNYIADTYGQANGLEDLDMLSEEEAQERIEKVYNSHLSTFAKFLNEEANILAGKTALIDRGLEGIIGRRGITFLDTVNKQVGSNMVGFNISSSLTNFLPVAQTFAKTNKFDFVKAFGQTVGNKIGSVFGRTDSFAEQSPVIIRRKGADRFYRTPWQKAGDAGYVFMSAVDDISTELIARTKFNELTRKGMDAQKAHYETDKWVSRLMGDRSLGQMPQLYNSKMLGLVTKFQLEVRNQLDSQFYDTVQETKASAEHVENGLARNAKIAAKVASTFTQLAVVQHLFGKAFESVAGYNPAFDIISVLLTAFGYDDEEDSEDTALDNIEQAFLELLEDLPYTSVFTDGGRIPVSSALPIGEFIKGEDEWGNEKSRWKTLGEIAPYYVLPGGYGQIKKTKQGLSMFSDDHPIAGSYTDSGNLRFPVEDTLKNRVQAGIFGQWANENARDYFDNERSPLKPKQIEEFIDLDLPIRDYWEYREGLSGLSKLAEKADYIAGLDLPIDKKNLLINNIADRKEDIDMTGYDDYAGFEEFDFAVKNPEKYEIAEKVGGYEAYKKYQDGMKDMKLAEKVDYIAGLDLTTEQKNALINGETDRKEPIDLSGYDTSAYSSFEEFEYAKEYPEKYAVAKAVGGYDAYKGYSSELNDIKADKDENGKSISGSRKEKVLDYINDLDADYYTKIILWKSEYTSDDTYNTEIIDYLNSRDDISFEETIAILRKLGFDVTDDGDISW